MSMPIERYISSLDYIAGLRGYPLLASREQVSLLQLGVQRLLYILAV